MSKHLDKAQCVAFELATKTEGIAHLLYFYDKHSSSERDRDAMQGISMILEDLAKQGRELAEMLDGCNIRKATDQEKKAV